MMKKFEYPNPDSISNMVKMLRNLNEVLNALSEGKIPNSENYSFADLQKFCITLIENQRNRLNQYFPSGSWCLMNPELLKSAPSDARFDFVDKPSYIALSILIFVKIHYPTVLENLVGCDNAIKYGLQFSAARKLHGHGYERSENQKETIEIFDNGGVLRFAVENSDICPEFNEMLKSYLVYLQDCLKNPSYVGFYENSAEEYKKLINLLQIFEID